MNIIEKLIEEKIADNGFRAAAIANGLNLVELPDDEARLSRARLYRDWRNSKIYGKNTAPCFEMAIKGEPVPQQALIPEALHTKIQEELLRELGF